jgi:hypothetical protein
MAILLNRRSFLAGMACWFRMPTGTHQTVSERTEHRNNHLSSPHTTQYPVLEEIRPDGAVY